MRLRRALIGTAGLAAALLAGVALAEYLGWPFLARPAAAYAAQRLERSVELSPGAGAFRLQLLGGIRLRLQRLVVGNPSWSALGPMLDAHVFYRGWPDALGGSLPANVVFPVPVEVAIADATKMYYMGDNGTLADAIKTVPRDVDVKFRADVNNDGKVDAADMFADIWVSRLGAIPAPGSGAAQGSGYLGPGVGAAGSDAYLFFDLHSKGQSVGNATSTTSADYRALIRN